MYQRLVLAKLHPSACILLVRGLFGRSLEALPAGDTDVTLSGLVTSFLCGVRRPLQSVEVPESGRPLFDTRINTVV